MTAITTKRALAFTHIGAAFGVITFDHAEIGSRVRSRGSHVRSRGLRRPRGSRASTRPAHALTRPARAHAALDAARAAANAGISPRNASDFVSHLAFTGRPCVARPRRLHRGALPQVPTVERYDFAKMNLQIESDAFSRAVIGGDPTMSDEVPLDAALD